MHIYNLTFFGQSRTFVLTLNETLCWLTKHFKKKLNNWSLFIGKCSHAVLVGYCRYECLGDDVKTLQISAHSWLALWRGFGLWINKFTVRNCVRKIFISRQQKSLPKIAKCQKNRVVDSFPYMQKQYMFFSLQTLLIW